MNQFQFTRRGFLYSAAAPLAAAGHSPRAKSRNDDWNVLSIGVGSRGTGIGYGVGSYGRIVAVCDVNRDAAEQFAGILLERQSRPDLYSDYRKALERKDVDVVTIGTPDHWHTPILLAALRAGKDVYCEKPMTLTIDEGKRICRAVKETGRIVQVGTQQRTEFNQIFLKAVAAGRSGVLGKKLTATCSVGAGPDNGPFTPTDPPASLDWDMWLGQAPKVPYVEQRAGFNFRWWYEYSGGIMTDWGAHHLDIAHWALGVENTGPIEIEGQGILPLSREDTLDIIRGRAQTITNRYNTVTTFRVVLRFANGNTIIVQDGPGNGIEIAGELSSISASREKLVGEAFHTVLDTDRSHAWLEEEALRLYGSVPSTHIRNFQLSVQARKQPISDVFTHHRAVSSCHLATIAILLNRKLRWDPVKEDFIGDSEASSLLSRPQRKPYNLEA